MGFWRQELIDFALDQETDKLEAEQKEWISREPTNPRPYYQLAQFYRTRGRADAALALLLHSTTLDSEYGDAHSSLAEMYVVRGDYSAAWRHALIAERNGKMEAAALLRRHGIEKPDS